MKAVFYNQSDNRLRAGWRILLFIILFWCLAAVSLVIKPLFGELTKKEYMEGFSIVIVSILAVAATLAVWIGRSYLDRESFKSLGLVFSKRAGADLLFGVSLSAAMAGTFLLVALQLNLVEIQGFGFASDNNFAVSTSGFLAYMQHFSLGVMLILLLEHIMVGYWEELVFRGYLFQNMREGMGLFLAIGISCLIYGIIHHLNPNATLLSSSIIVLFGFLRIYGYLATGMLWLSIGMHIGWNFFQGPIFGFGASGHEMATLVKLQVNGPDWLSGGSFGPEGSVIIIPIVLLALGAMHWWSQRNQQVPTTPAPRKQYA